MRNSSIALFERLTSEHLGLKVRTIDADVKTNSSQIIHQYHSTNEYVTTQTKTTPTKCSNWILINP